VTPATLIIIAFGLVASLLLLGLRMRYPSVDPDYRWREDVPREPRGLALLVVRLVLLVGGVLLSLAGFEPAALVAFGGFLVLALADIALDWRATIRRRRRRNTHEI